MIGLDFLFFDEVWVVKKQKTKGRLNTMSINSETSGRYKNIRII